MGLLRFLFASSVLLFHAGLIFGYNITNERIAVMSFFVISGFYMAFILERKYTAEKGVRLFLTNRLLRIFPLYWVILAITFAFVLLKYLLHIGSEDNAIIHYIVKAPHDSVLASIAAFINFIIRNITLIITTDYFIKPDRTPGYLLVQQAWTLQYELLFYLFIPFLMRLSKQIFVLISISFVLILFGIITPLKLIPSYSLTYGFLNSLPFFLLGVASYLFIYTQIEHKQKTYVIGKIVLLIFFGYLLMYSFFVSIPILKIFVQDVFYFSFLALSIPFIFLATSKSKLDSIIGSLSYPIYISHFLILKLLTNIGLFRDNAMGLTAATFFGTVLASIGLLLLIDRPVDIFRQHRLLHKSNTKGLFRAKFFSMMNRW